MVDGCAKNNLGVILSKAKEVVVDFTKREREKQKTPLTPLRVSDEDVEMVESFRFHGDGGVVQVLGLDHLKHSQMGRQHQERNEKNHSNAFTSCISLRNFV